MAGVVTVVATITTVNYGGVTVSNDGRLCIINRRFNAAVRPSLSGFWHHLNTTTGNRKDSRWPNPEEPFKFLKPFDMNQYNGQSVKPVDVFGTDAPGKNDWKNLLQEDGTIAEAVVEKSVGKKKRP